MNTYTATIKTTNGTICATKTCMNVSPKRAAETLLPLMTQHGCDTCEVTGAEGTVTFIKVGRMNLSAKSTK